MNITPIDIQQYQFKNQLMGYDKTGVDQFLERVAEELENLHRENQELKETLARTRQSLEDMRQTESTLKEALLTTQRVTDGLKGNARKEAELIIEGANLKAEKIIRQAEQKRMELTRQIQEINRQKIIFETTLKSLIERHHKMLEEIDWPEIPEALVLADDQSDEEVLETEDLQPVVEESSSLEEKSEAARDFLQEWNV